MVAYLLAMQDARVQFPLPAPQQKNRLFTLPVNKPDMPNAKDKMPQEFWNFDINGLKAENFMEIFQTFGNPRVMIEIGVYAGGTAVPLLHHVLPHVPNLQYIGIDPYTTSEDLQDDLDQIHQRLIDIIQDKGYDKNFELIRKKSFDGLLELHHRGVQPDLIYIDGDHTAPTVLSDLVLSFELLKPGGMIICDDCPAWAWTDDRGHRDPTKSPRMAVENFIMCNWNRIQTYLLKHGLQTAFLKR